MTKLKKDALLNGIGPAHPLELTKCGEIQIDDCCTNAYIFCAFCIDEGENDTNIFKTLQEFIDHIRWHRSDTPESPIIPNDPSNPVFETISGDMGVTPLIAEADYLTDWLAPPEELFELNTMNDIIEPEPQAAVGESKTLRTEQENQKDSMASNAKACVGNLENESASAQPTHEEEAPEITGEVFIEVVDFLKKCPCLWHYKTAATTNSQVIDTVYKLLAEQFNKLSQLSKPIDYVRGLIIQIKNGFFEEHKGIVYTGTESLPWYFPYLRFILNCDSDELDKNIFTDFKCPICTLEQASQEELWKHLLKLHIETTTSKESNHHSESPSDITFITGYPEEVLDKFIDTYKSQNRLWDKRNKEYYSRVMRRKSYNMLLNILRDYDPKATRAHVARIINYLRSKIAGSNNKRRKISLENTKMACRNQLKISKGNITMKKYRKPPPQLKLKPANLKKIIKTGKCPVCSLTFSGHAAYLDHLETEHSTEDFQSKDGFFYCTICGWQNKTNKLLIRHLRTRHTYNRYRCSDCDLGFPLLSMLVDHRAITHKDFNPFKCEKCGDGFSNRSSLRTHLTTHMTNEDGFYCKHCQTKFVNKESCSHMVDKTDLKTHKCDKCFEEFQSPQVLASHLNEMHDETKAATITSKTAIAQSNDSPENQSRSRCDACGAKFLRKSSLQKHIRLRHGEIASSSKLN